jgi:hypothetical protein
MVECTVGEDPSTFTGYQVELFTLLSKDLGWEDGDWTMVCMPYTDMMNDLKSPAGNCTLAAAGKLEPFRSRGWPSSRCR